MGVFARLRRKSKGMAEEAGSASPEDVVAADGDPGGAEAAPGGCASADSVDGDGATVERGVDIPKQQTADEAADNEAGEDAHK